MIDTQIQSGAAPKVQMENWRLSLGLCFRWRAASEGFALEGIRRADLIIGGIDHLLLAPIHPQRDTQLRRLFADGMYWPAEFGSDLRSGVFLSQV
jgi:hypothetical protein